MAAPDAPRTRKAFATVQALSGAALSDRVAEEAGEEVLAAFHALARALAPSDDEVETAKKVHLLMFGYLMRAELER